MAISITKSQLSTANKSLREKKYAEAMFGYVEATLSMPELSPYIAENIALVRKRSLEDKKNRRSTKVVVCGWELAHNAAGRAHTLAEIYKQLTAEVKILGSIFPRWGGEVWEPIRNSKIPLDYFVVKTNDYIKQVVTLVAKNPADIVHLSKPRAPNLFFGLFYKLLWGARVYLDIDEEELAFVKAKDPLSLEEYLKCYEKLPTFDQLADNHWTRIAVGLANEFDGITVSNEALRKKYGGIVVGHARDSLKLQPCEKLRNDSRRDLGIGRTQKVVLFSGTPRPHKGLVEVAQAIQSLRRNDVVFVIAGSFANGQDEFKKFLQRIKGVKYIFLENRPIEDLSKTLAVADCCVLLQNIHDPRSTYQIPAKLTDAFAMGIPVITTSTEALSEVVKLGAVMVTKQSELTNTLNKILNNSNHAQIQIAKKYFKENLMLNVVSEKLSILLNPVNNPASLSPAMREFARLYAEGKVFLNED